MGNCCSTRTDHELVRKLELAISQKDHITFSDLMKYADTNNICISYGNTTSPFHYFLMNAINGNFDNTAIKAFCEIFILTSKKVPLKKYMPRFKYFVSHNEIITMNDYNYYIVDTKTLLEYKANGNIPRGYITKFYSYNVKLHIDPYLVLKGLRLIVPPNKKAIVDMIISCLYKPSNQASPPSYEQSI